MQLMDGYGSLPGLMFTLICSVHPEFYIPQSQSDIYIYIYRNALFWRPPEVILEA